MKKATHLIVLIFAIALLSGCSQLQNEPQSSDSKVSKIESIPFEDTQQYAVAYLGYGEINDLSFYVQNYLDSENIPIHYISQGEYYLVIPRYPAMSVSLYKNDIETMEPTLLYEDAECTPFIVQCNYSDIFADLTVSFKYNDETIQFSPYISLENGAVKVGERGLNLTKQAA